MIKVSYLVSYDYSMLLISVKQLYDYVDKIVVAIDSERKTWSGNSFHIPESFFNEITKFDTKNKIEFYFDSFYVKELSPIECETRERNMLLSKMGNGWKIQLDVDEYIYDFKSVAKYLNKNWVLTIFPKYTPICIHGRLITLYKQLPNGFVYIDNNESFPFITNLNYNIHTRCNKEIRNHFSNIKVIHQSWARSASEIQQKIKNWGHRDDFDTMQYFEFWKGLDVDNYRKYRNIHPLSPEVWNELHFLKSNNVNKFIIEYSKSNKQVLVQLPIKKIFKTAIKKMIGKE